MPAYQSSNYGSKFQRGGAMLVMLVILVMGITTVFVTSLSGTAISNKRNQTTADALARAKEALIGYAISYGDTHPAEPVPGYLPCPDITGGTSEGSSDTCGTAGANSMGRLPWKTLDLPSIFDGQQDCLWYAVSGNYKNNPKYGGQMNWDTPAQLHVFDSNGNELQAGEVVAVIFSPGTPLSGNSDRSGTTAPICGGNYTASAYLDNDTTHNINNADISAAKFILPHEHRNASGNVTLTINDQFVYITRKDIWTAAEKRIAREAKLCLDAYAATSGNKYPWAVPASTPTAFSPLIMGENNTLFGRLPTRPSVQLVSTPPMITTMQSKFNELWTALAVFAASKTSTNLSAMQTKASAAKDAANNVKDDYISTPLEDPARSLKNAAKDAKDNLTTSSSAAAIAAIQQDIVDAANDFITAMTLQFLQASDMSNTWPTSCTLFSSERWTNHWQNLIFYQLADGYKPGSAAACGTAPNTCLSIEGSGHSASGSGSYRAVIIAAGKKLTANRDVSTPGDYLEADNLLPRNDVSKPYKTYRTTDAAHQNTNDLVLCLDGGSGNCP